MSTLPPHDNRYYKADDQKARTELTGGNFMPSIGGWDSLNHYPYPSTVQIKVGK